MPKCSCIGDNVFFDGINDANEKKDFRIVEEIYSEENNEIDEKYLFRENDHVSKQYYVVLYEMEEKYIVASLMLEDGKIVKDLNR